MTRSTRYLVLAAVVVASVILAAVGAHGGFI
jgi:hypothetical protein